jgi:CheY-like chemotaxis protein
MLKPQSRALRILVVDDHTDSALVLTALLRRKGHTVATAHTLAGGMGLGSVFPLDLLICDISLPDGDGCELLRRLVAVSGDRGLPRSPSRDTGRSGWRRAARRATGSS